MSYNMYEPNQEIYYLDELPWRLDIPYFEIDAYTKDMLFAANMLQEQHLSIRNTTKETGIARSTLHAFIHGPLGHICYELQRLCIHQLQWNKENISYFMKKSKLYHK